MSTGVIVEGTFPRIQGQPGPERVEISTFVKNTRQFSLYVQALQTIFNVDRNSSISYWQIAGIHGQPIRDYDGVSSGGKFFCAHNSPVFPTWHRPYVVLIEQEIQRIARQIATRYTYEHSQWEAAASSLRQPYWGWDSRETFVLPDEVILSHYVMIRKPESPNLVAVSNPFLAFTYPDGANAALSAPFNGWSKTTRYPNATGASQPRRLLAALQSPVQAQQIVDNTARLYSLTTWNTFVFGSGGTSGLESIHNTIHVLTGGSGPGNMASIPAAAFDPIFWLHHTQVDRVTELWHRRHRVWTNDPTNLLPFRRTRTVFWQSPQMESGTAANFNYSYSDPLKMKASSFIAIEDSEANKMDKNLSSMVNLSPANQLCASVRAEDVSVNADFVTPEWSVRVRCKQFEVGGSFSVYVFLSDSVPPNHEEWLFHPTFVGTFDVFANPNPDKCPNCTAHAESPVNGFVHINKQFVEISGNTSFKPDVVLPYLKENLSWGVVKVDGEVVDLQNFPSLEVSVLCMPLKYTLSQDYPAEREPTAYPEITRGRLGGCHVA